MTGTIGNRLIQLRKLARMTRKFLREKYNVSENTLRKWEENALNVSDEKIDLMCYIYNSESIHVTREWIKSGKGTAPYFSAKGKNSGKKELESLLKNDDLLALEELKHLVSIDPDKMVFMLLENDSMFPYYHPNSWIIGRKNVIQNECVGKDCIVKIKDVNSLTFRRVINSEKKDRYNLHILNNYSNTIDNPIIANIEAEFIAPITWIRKIYEK